MFGISLDDVIAFVILNKWWFFALVPFAIADMRARFVLRRCVLYALVSIRPILVELKVNYRLYLRSK